MSKSSAMFPFLLMILVLATERVSAAGYSHFDTGVENKMLTAQDGITMSIREVHETEQFVQFMRNLRTVRFTKQAAHLEPCVNGLIQDLNKMKSTLQILTDPKPMNIKSNTESLEETMTRIVQLGQRCSHSLKNVDMVVPSMLTRKIDDLSMVINDFVYHSSMMDAMA